MSRGFSVTIIEQQIVSKLWSRVEKLVIDYTDRKGRTSRLVREVSDHGMAAAVLAYDPSRRTVLLVRQMRIAAYVAGYHEAMLEVCAGLLDGDTAEACAKREALEEMGCEIHDLEPLGQVFVSPGSLTEAVYLFIARYGPQDRKHSGGGLASEGEDIEIVEMGFDEAYGLIASGGIVDAKTIILLQHLRLKSLSSPSSGVAAPSSQPKRR